MNKELAKRIIKTLQGDNGLSYVSLWGGVVRTLTTTEAGANKNIKIVRNIPVADYFETEKCGDFDVLPMVADSSESVMVYFEDYGTTQNENRRLANGLVGWTSNIDLVCWINTKKLNKVENVSASSSIINDIVKRLQSHRKSKGYFIGLDMVVTSIKPQNASIFSKYSYDEKINQYLSEPFEYFSISIQANYFANPACVASLTLNENQIC